MSIAGKQLRGGFAVPTPVAVVTTALLSAWWDGWEFALYLGTTVLLGSLLGDLLVRLWPTDS